MQLSSNWSTGEQELVGRTLSKPDDGAPPCEITLSPRQACAGVAVTCGARTCEVSVGTGRGAPSYSCTLRGLPAGGDADGAFVFEHRPSGGLLAGSSVVLRLLSLVHRGSVHIHSVEALTSASAPALGPAAAAERAASNASQMEGIRAMLQGMAVSSAGGAGSSADADPKRALMEALARSALSRQDLQPPAAPIQAAAKAAPEAPVAEELLAAVRAQSEVLRGLQAAVARLEASGAETQRLVQQLARAVLGKDAEGDTAPG